MAVLKGAGKVAGVGIADFIRNLNDTEAIFAQETGSIIHSNLAQIAEGCLSVDVFEGGF